MPRLRRRVTYANVMSTLAVVLALGGGTAVAAGLINGRRIVRHSISGAKLKSNTLTGRQVAESRLGRVPRARRAVDAIRLGGVPAAGYLRLTGKAQDAERLDGADSSAFARGQNVVLARRGVVLPSGAAATFTPLLVLPGLGALAASCSGGGHDVTLRYTSTTLAGQFVTREVTREGGAGPASPQADAVAAGGTDDVSVTGLPNVGGAAGRLSIVRDVPAADSAEVLFSAVAQSSGAPRCLLTATAVSGQSP
jgi:hypothetical protein